MQTTKVTQLRAYPIVHLTEDLVVSSVEVEARERGGCVCVCGWVGGCVCVCVWVDVYVCVCVQVGGCGNVCVPQYTLA